jgi:hypothetical protein
MASWAAVIALPGFHYSGVTKRMTFAPKEGQFFWSTGYSWGQCTLQNDEDSFQIELYVKNGALNLETFELKGIGEIKLDTTFISSQDNNIVKFKIQKQRS